MFQKLQLVRQKGLEPITAQKGADTPTRLILLLLGIPVTEHGFMTITEAAVLSEHIIRIAADAEQQ